MDSDSLLASLRLDCKTPRSYGFLGHFRPERSTCLVRYAHGPFSRAHHVGFVDFGLRHVSAQVAYGSF